MMPRLKCPNIFVLPLMRPDLQTSSQCMLEHYKSLDHGENGTFLGVKWYNNEAV